MTVLKLYPRLKSSMITSTTNVTQEVQKCLSCTNVPLESVKESANLIGVTSVGVTSDCRPFEKIASILLCNMASRRKENIFRTGKFQQRRRRAVEIFKAFAAVRTTRQRAQGTRSKLQYHSKVEISRLISKLLDSLYRPLNYSISLK